MLAIAVALVVGCTPGDEGLADSVFGDSIPGNGNATDDVVGEEQEFPVVELQPEFPGGMEALMTYLQDNINYPEISRENNSQGTVIIRFIVGADGSIQDVEVLQSSGDIYLDEEAVRVVEGMPEWTPGKYDGKPVRVLFTLPLVFRLA